MDITHRTDGPNKCLLLEGRLDAREAGAVLKAIEATVLHAGDRLTLDLRGVPYLSSAGIRVLLLARRRCEQHQASLVLCGIQPYCLEVLQVGGLENSFQFADSSL
ncbi:MAG: STAS domain-containing protein [Terrimicrobiaceae bacterium]